MSHINCFIESNEGLKNFFEADRAPPQYLLEAYIAGLFATIWRDVLEKCEIRLVSEEFPDAQLRAPDQCLKYRDHDGSQKGLSHV